MADAGFFKGTSADQDRRFSDKELKLLKTIKFPPQFDTKVDMRKVNLQVIRPWVAKKVVELIGLEDELVVEYAMGLLEDESQPTPDPKKMQINLTGFLTDSTPAFMVALWNLLIEAQTSPAGIPQSFVEEKKEEMRRAKEGDTRALVERDRRMRLDEIRERERLERSGRGGGRGRGRGRRVKGGVGNDDRPDNRPRDNGWSSRGGGRPRYRSPPPRSRSPPTRGRTPSSDRSSRSGGPPRRSRSRTPVRTRSRSPPLRRRSPSLRSPSSSPPRRRRRSLSPSPRGQERDRRARGRDSRSPPARRRRISPPARRRTTSRSPDQARRRRSPSPRRSRNDRSLSSERSPLPRKRSGRGRREDRSRSRGAENGRSTKRLPSRSRSRTRSLSPHVPYDDGKGKGRDFSSPSGPTPGIKIKGQAKVERQRNKVEAGENSDISRDYEELSRRESELKERALRNKVVRTRKRTTSNPPTESVL
ncbi:hypothetical protein B0F90DRAFT_1714636 [Multifurca ochricompacta]|uniref:PWI domain-containing protein n=1 Tax=Multifurca ochricompacta TaxID=376703 RepID=A0AAD4M637_9AGAM|nr:hypothetical protein B0F90DRAFT_1714636 [Multifurca ochricompacta]